MKATAEPDENAVRTIVHEILDSSMPPAEKRYERILDEVTTVTGAGFESTASVLRMLVFHVYYNPAILERLRSELASVSSPSGNVELQALEKLPYMTATLMEALRLSPAIGSRMARISDKDIFYDEWRIPAGTPVGSKSMPEKKKKNVEYTP